MPGDAQSVLSALEEFNRLARELSQRMARAEEELDDACDILARIRLTQVDIEKGLKMLKEKVEALEKLKHKHFWQGNVSL
jgi:chromosome segregation ATPase